VSDAAEAVVNGIESRARRVVFPRWVKLMLAMRDSLGVITEKQVADVMPEVERAVEADIAARGAEASAPVGAGGEADRRQRMAASS
jgi:hypothetical protein